MRAVAPGQVLDQRHPWSPGIAVRHHAGGPLRVSSRRDDQLLTAPRAPTERGNASLGCRRAHDPPYSSRPH
jgi:hypothetical protein